MESIREFFCCRGISKFLANRRGDSPPQLPLPLRKDLHIRHIGQLIYIYIYMYHLCMSHKEYQFLVSSRPSTIDISSIDSSFCIYFNLFNLCICVVIYNALKKSFFFQQKRKRYVENRFSYYCRISLPLP